MESSNQNTTEGTMRNKFDGSIALLLAGAIYLIIYSIVLVAINGFTSLLQEGYYLAYYLLPGLVSAVLGLVAAYQLQRGKATGGTMLIGFTSVGIGFVVTLLFYFISFEVNGIIGPAWIIFVLAGYWLYRNRSQSSN